MRFQRNYFPYITENSKRKKNTTLEYIGDVLLYGKGLPCVIIIQRKNPSDFRAQVKLLEEAAGGPQKDTCHLQGKHVE